MKNEHKAAVVITRNLLSALATLATKVAIGHVDKMETRRWADHYPYKGCTSCKDRDGCPIIQEYRRSLRG